MAPIIYYIQNYDKFSKYTIEKNDQDYICISINTMIKFTPKTSILGKKIEIDSRDFIIVDMFLIDKKIKRNFKEFSMDNITKFIIEDYTDAINYLIEIDFAGCNLVPDDLLDLLDFACNRACTNIIMAFITYINWEEYKNDEFGGYFSRMFGMRDEDIIRLVLDNIPINCFDYPESAHESIKSGRLENYKILIEKFPLEDTTNHLGMAIINGHIEILEYMESKGVDLKDFLDKHLDMIIWCSKMNDMGMIEYLFDRFEFSESQLDVLLSTAYNSKPEYVDILIDAGANFVFYGEQLYIDAMIERNVVLAEYLKENYL